MIGVALGERPCGRFRPKADISCPAKPRAALRFGAYDVSDARNERQAIRSPTVTSRELTLVLVNLLASWLLAYGITKDRILEPGKWATRGHERLYWLGIAVVTAAIAASALALALY